MTNNDPLVFELAVAKDKPQSYRKFHSHQKISVHFVMLLILLISINVMEI